MSTSHRHPLFEDSPGMRAMRLVAVVVMSWMALHGSELILFGGLIPFLALWCLDREEHKVARDKSDA